MKTIKCVIMDWAGTAIDYGCFAPLNAFMKVFSEEKGIQITLRQAREPMGMLKIDHIRQSLPCRMFPKNSITATDVLGMKTT